MTETQPITSRKNNASDNNIKSIVQNKHTITYTVTILAS